MTTDTAAERIHALVSKHPGVAHGDISRVLSMRRQTRQRAHRFLVASGRIVGTLRADGKSLSWTPREPHRAEPVPEPRPEPVSETATLSVLPTPPQPVSALVIADAPPKPSALTTDQLDFQHGRGKYAYLNDPLGFE